MNIDAWQAALALVAAAGGTWSASRWWHLRQVKALRQQMLKLDAAAQTASRLGAQARKQVDDLQRVVVEYRRRIAASEQRRPTPAMAAPVATTAATAHPSAPVLPRIIPGGWADTQPM
jgi:hypothetical protein